MNSALIAISIVFCAGYIAIATEHVIKIDKTATALLTGVICWTLYILNADTLLSLTQIPDWFRAEHVGNPPHEIMLSWISHFQLVNVIGEISSILFFLLGAMTIVELVDAHGGFDLITRRIQSRNTAVLLTIVSIFAFFLSAILDNLTTTIVMISLIRKLIADQQDRWFFAGIIVIAANAGGAWSPIGDVTTTMLWIGGQISTANIVKSVFLPSLACLAIPLIYLVFKLRGKTIDAVTPEAQDKNVVLEMLSPAKRNILFTVGMVALLFVPVFKTVTHLPPVMGMMLSLAIVWIVSEILHEDKDQALDSGLHIIQVLKRIDSPSVLFFLGILLAVSALEATGLLASIAGALNNTVGNVNVIVFLIGLLSAIVDNVPLVAATMGMYDLNAHPMDSAMWEYLAFAAGTGGSCLVIGSAAGVAAMGMEKISFGWYARNIGGLALAGYVGGSILYFALQ